MKKKLKNIKVTGKEKEGRGAVWAGKEHNYTEMYRHKDGIDCPAETCY
jgi:hypothetical protein